MLFLQVEWILSEHYGGIMVWELSMDDFSGSFCGKGPNDSFPLLRAIVGAKLPEHNATSPIYPIVTQIGETGEFGNVTGTFFSAYLELNSPYFSVTLILFSRKTVRIQ